jgi:hypothetical protein
VSKAEGWVEEDDARLDVEASQGFGRGGRDDMYMWNFLFRECGTRIERAVHR